MAPMSQQGFEDSVRSSVGPLAESLPFRWDDSYRDERGASRTLLSKGGYGVVSFASPHVPSEGLMDALCYAGDANGTDEWAASASVGEALERAGASLPLSAAYAQVSGLGRCVTLLDGTGTLLGVATEDNWTPLAHELVARANALAANDIRTLSRVRQSKSITRERATVELARMEGTGRPEHPAREQCPVFPTPAAAPCHGGGEGKWPDCQACVGETYSGRPYETVCDGVRDGGAFDPGF